MFLLFSTIILHFSKKENDDPMYYKNIDKTSNLLYEKFESVINNLPIGSSIVFINFIVFIICFIIGKIKK